MKTSLKKKNGAVDARRDPERFSRDAMAVVGPLQQALVAAIRGVPGRIKKSMDLQRALELGPRPAWQIYKFAFSETALASSAMLPGAVQIRNFVEAAAERGVTVELLNEVTEKFDAFEEFVSSRVGDRTAYNSIVGQEESGEAASLTHKRAMFRAAAHFTGAQTDLSVSALMLMPQKRVDGPWDLVWVTYRIGVQRLKPDARVVLTQLYSPSDIVPAPDKIYLVPVEPEAKQGSIGSMISSFCTSPQPDAMVVHRKGEQITVELAESGLGSAAATDWAFGIVEKNTNRRLSAGSAPLKFDSSTISAIETTVHDFLVHEDIGVELAGEVKTYLNTVFMSRTPGDGSSDTRQETNRLNMIEEVVPMGRADIGLTLKDAPRYGELLAHVAETQSTRLEKFRLYRCVIKFPMIGTNRELTFTPAPSKA